MTVEYQAWLQRPARVGNWRQLSEGTFWSATEKINARETERAAELVAVALDEASELRDVYARWPKAAQAWMLDQGAQESVLDIELDRLGALLETGGNDVEAGWSEYLDATDLAIDACTHQSAATAVEAIESARQTWLKVHDEAVDWTAGVVDVAVRLIGESKLGELWSFLMADWIAAHASRYELAQQDWSDTITQLALSIFDGFHAHLTGTARQGDIELIHEADRIGFRFAPCGSGGRSVDPVITAGKPRSAAPFGFAVTTQQHDWAWNKVGICSYCVHCCVLNELAPIDRLGYPTRVIDAPTWPAREGDTSCTWWIYRDPSLIPDWVYARVGREPDQRAAKSHVTVHRPNHNWPEFLQAAAKEES